MESKDKLSHCWLSIALQFEVRYHSVVLPNATPVEASVYAASQVRMLNIESLLLQREEAHLVAACKG